MYKNPHSNNLLLNLGIENLNEMQEMASAAILNDVNVLLLSPTGFNGMSTVANIYFIIGAHFFPNLLNLQT